MVTVALLLVLIREWTMIAAPCSDYCAMQTFSQYLQSLAGASTKQTSLHSTMDNENIVGLYKQQQSDDQFKVGSPSGSVFWTAGKLLGTLPTGPNQGLSIICHVLRHQGPARTHAAQELSASSGKQQLRPYIR